MHNKISISKKAQLSGHNAAIYKLVPGLKLGHFISGSGDGWIVDWEETTPETGKLIAQSDRQVFSLLAIPEQELLLAGNMEGYLNWVDLRNTEASKRTLMHPGGIFGLARSGDYFYALGGDGVLSKWDLLRRRVVESLRLSTKSLRSFSFHPDDAVLAIGASDGHIYFVDEKEFVLINVIKDAHDKSVFSLAFSYDGGKLLSGGRDALLKCWHFYAKQPKLETTINAHWFTINAIAFHPKGHIFATASRDKTMKIWETKTLKVLKVLEGVRDGGHVNSVNTLLWIDEGKFLVSAGDDRMIILWELFESRE